MNYKNNKNNILHGNTHLSCSNLLSCNNNKRLLPNYTNDSFLLPNNNNRLLPLSNYNYHPLPSNTKSFPNNKNDFTLIYFARNMATQQYAIAPLVQEQEQEQ